jgi:HEAT repeat protein
MDELPPEDKPDVIWIGPVGPIPIIDEDDPRFDEERAAWSAARRKAQAMHSADDLLQGLTDPDWRVRHEVVDRLIARARTDARTLPALLRAATEDDAWQVRAKVTMRLIEFDPEAVRAVLLGALTDSSPEVRWSARYALDQLGTE